MDTSSKLDCAALSSQCEAAITALKQDNETLLKISTSYSNFSSSTQLQGCTFNEARTHATNQANIINAVVSANQEDIVDHNNLIGLLDGYYYDGDTILTNQKTALGSYEYHNREANYYYNLIANLPPTLALIGGLGPVEYWGIQLAIHENAAKSAYDEYLEYKELEEKFDEIAAASASYFTNGTAYRNIAVAGFKETSVDFEGGKYSSVQFGSTWMTDLEKLHASLQSEYEESWKNPDGSYNMDAIAELMSQDPDEVSVDEYYALVSAYDNMTEEERERFLEVSYLYVGERATSTSSEYDDNIFMQMMESNAYANSGMTSVFYQYQLSGVFNNFAYVYAASLSEEVQCIQSGNIANSDLTRIQNYAMFSKMISSYSTAFTYTINYSSDKAPVAIHIDISREDKKFETDYMTDMTVSINACFNNSYRDEIIPFTVCAYRPDVDDIISRDITTEQLQGLKADILEECITNGANVAASVAACVVLTPIGGLIYSGVVGDIQAAESVSDAIEMNYTIDGIISNETVGNVCDALNMAGCVVKDANGYSVVMPYCDLNLVQERIDEYNSCHSVPIYVDPTQVMQYIATGNASFFSSDVIEFAEYIREREEN